jgi:hypothetical protein
MKNIVIILTLLFFASCHKENIPPKSIWDKTFGPYNVLNKDSITFSQDMIFPGNEQIFVAASFVADSNMTIHSKAVLNLYTQNILKFYIAVNGITKANNDASGGFNGLKTLEIDGIDLLTGDKLECYIGYSKDNITLYKEGSYFLIESYK